MNPAPRTRFMEGFTLIELLVVMTIVALLLALAVPRYFGGLEKSKEVALRQTLSVTRDALDKYFGDNGRFPDTLDTLVNKRYLRSLPVDPITGSSTSWTMVPPEDPAKGSIRDIRSGAEGTGRDGKPFREW
jgi:prepilin-type N-terminal cleavage/methylation domain-containing protein